MYSSISSRLLPLPQTGQHVVHILRHPSLLTFSYTKAHLSVHPYRVGACCLTIVHSFQHPNYHMNMGASKNKVRTKAVESLVSWKPNHKSSGPTLGLTLFPLGGSQVKPVLPVEKPGWVQEARLACKARSGQHCEKPFAWAKLLPE